MFRFLKPVRWRAVLCCCILASGILVEVQAVNLAGATVNHIGSLQATAAARDMGMWRWLFSADPDALKLRYLILLLCVFVAMMSVLRFFRETSNMRMSMDMVFTIREAVYDKLQRVGFGFHDAISSGQLINRALSDLQNVRAFIQTALLTSLDIVLGVTGYIILIAEKNPYVAILALVPLPIWTLYILRFSKKVQPAAKAVLEAEDRSIQVVTENIAGVHVIKAFATEKQEVAKYQGALTNFLTRALSRIRMFANFQPVIRSIASASHLSLFLLAGIIIILQKGRGMNVGDLMILGGAMGAILGRLQQVATINEQYQNAIVSARRLWEVLTAPPTVPERPDAIPLPKNGPGEVRFENVVFGYGATKVSDGTNAADADEPRKPVLHDISFAVPGGSVVAIVGPTGAGKSTLVNLLARFYDPWQGRVLIDGVDLRDLSLHTLRTQVSLVFQETYLFSDTVSANIAYGRPGISQGEIESAARLAQAHEFIEKLSQGYDTQLGERGTNLSGGQRQRLAIARAIVTNPRVMILDDATAAVDPETEDLIRRGMRLTLFGRTTFVIAHRISTVKSADLVLVLEHGRITQMGTHEQLMAQEGHYREIADVQLASVQPAKGEEPSHMKRVQHNSVVAAGRRAAGHVKDVEMDTAG